MTRKDRYKIGSIIPIDGQPSIPNWMNTIEQVDYPVAMSYYGQTVMNADFNGYGKKTTVISHGVDTEFFANLKICKNQSLIVLLWDVWHAISTVKIFLD